MPRNAPNLRSLARKHTTVSINCLAGIVISGTSETARCTAAALLLEKGWGRTPQALTGPDGEGPLEMIVRHIYEGKAKGEK